MRQRTQEIAEVVRDQPTDVKKLQLRLQGSISVQVNAGPLAYASAFLRLPSSSSSSTYSASADRTTYPEEQVHELRDLFKDFVNICGAALDLNGKLILNDQREYQEALRSSFRDLVQSLANILEDPSLTFEWEGSLGSAAGMLLKKRSSVMVFSAISGNESSTA